MENKLIESLPPTITTFYGKHNAAVCSDGKEKSKATCNQYSKVVLGVGDWKLKSHFKFCQPGKNQTNLHVRCCTVLHYHIVIFVHPPPAKAKDAMCNPIVTSVLLSICL